MLVKIGMRIWCIYRMSICRFEPTLGHVFLSFFFYFLFPNTHFPLFSFSLEKGRKGNKKHLMDLKNSYLTNCMGRSYCKFTLVFCLFVDEWWRDLDTFSNLCIVDVQYMYFKDLVTVAQDNPTCQTATTTLWT